MSLETQILALSRQNLTAREISESLGVEEPIVKAVLQRQGITNEELSDGDVADIMRRLTAIAKNNPDLHLAAKVGMWLVEQKRGRAPTRGEQSGPNIVMLQQIINNSYARFKELLGSNCGTSGDFRDGDSDNSEEIRRKETTTDGNPTG